MTINMYDYFTHINNNNYRRIINIFCKKNLLNFEIFWKFSFGASVHGPCIVPNKLVYSGIFSLEHERVYTRLLGRTEYCRYPQQRLEPSSAVFSIWAKKNCITYDSAQSNLNSKPKRMNEMVQLTSRLWSSSKK